MVYVLSSERRDKETTWPRHRSGGPHKRKGDVFKSIGKQDPNFTVRRMEVQMQEELEKIQSIKKVHVLYMYRYIINSSA